MILWISSIPDATSDGNPKYVGIHFSSGTFDDLPYAEDFENGDAEGRKIHGVWSKPFNHDFPENTPEPIKYAGCGWNPYDHTY